MGETLPDVVRVEVRGEVAVVSLARAGKRNALNVAMIEGLWRWFSAPPDGVRAAVLRGDGAHFCAGLNLSETTEQDAAAGVFHSRLWRRAFAAIESGEPVYAEHRAL